MTGSDLHFAQPAMIVAVWAWLGVWIAFGLLERRGSTLLDRLVAPALQAELVVRPSTWRRRTRFVLLGIAGFAMGVALMQPQMGERYVTTPRVGAEIMIAIDVSRSMLADDAKPTRLERAKAEVRDLLGYLGDDHVGLIAFAGRASVLSPMTPDKSFLRLALDSAGPHSVPRGGTNIAEAIRRAVVGFGEPGPAQRALILITDGEDHDSFAVDAAKAAAEAGIKIIAIGFGDENGSPIFVRDERTGARSQVLDGDGRPVISRLNGDLLRDIALETDGAFVPAGTGVLDLASIYDAHIAPLTRGQIDGQGRTIRDEAYQLFVLVALVCLVIAVWVGAGRGASGVSRPLSTNPIAVVLISCAWLASVAPLPAWAQVPPGAPLSVETEASAEAPPRSDGEEATASDPDEPQEDPRTRFNRGNAALAAGEFASAELLFREARSAAPDDPELRYAATYNLGQAAARKAEGLREGNPAGALEALREAADWFREAVRLRPDDDAPRHDLEVVLRRALILADEIAQAEQGKIEDALEALIESQRERNSASARLLEAVSRTSELDVVERLRPAFDAEATEERVLISEADSVADRILREREAILAMPEDTRAPEETLRALQLEGVLLYLDSALDRMGQMRKQLRQRRAERAYRRGASALGELKRARDQLRDPVEQIGVLLDDLGAVVRATGALAQASPLGLTAPFGLTAPLGPKAPWTAGADEDRRLPAFLTPENVEEDLRRLGARVVELGDRFGAAVANARAQAESPASEATADPSAPGKSAEAEAIKEALEAAAPLVATAGAQLGEAADAMASASLLSALDQEREAGQALADAQELFFDLVQLLATAQTDEARIAELAETDDPTTSAERDEYRPLLVELQSRNLARVPRLMVLLDRERTKRIAEASSAATEQTAGSAAASAEANEAPGPVEIEEQRFAVAAALLGRAEASMKETRSQLESEESDWGETAASAAAARDHLESIQSLFFSLVQHLHKLARDQVDLTDETREAIALAPTDAQGKGEPDQDYARGEDTQARASSLEVEQRALEDRAAPIADALLEQAEAAGDDAAPEQPAAGPSPEDLRRAAEHVAAAGIAMRDAAQVLGDASSPLAPAEGSQVIALEELAAALEILAPPPPPEESGEDQQEGGEGQPQPQPQDEGESDPSESQQDAGANPREDPEAAEEEMDADPSQLLQGVRDREAERRLERDRERSHQRSVPVDKDW